MSGERSVAVTETNLRKTAMRVLAGQKLVSTEVSYLQRTMESNTTQSEMDRRVLAVRRMPWANLVVPE